MRDLKTRLSPRPPCALSLPSPCADRAGPCSSLSLWVCLCKQTVDGAGPSVLLRSVFANARPRSSFALSLQTRCGLGCALGPPSPLARSPYFATCHGQGWLRRRSFLLPACLARLIARRPPLPAPACQSTCPLPATVRPTSPLLARLVGGAGRLLLPARRPPAPPPTFSRRGRFYREALPGRSADDGAPAFCVKMRTACAWACRRFLPAAVPLPLTGRATFFLSVPLPRTGPGSSRARG